MNRRKKYRHSRKPKTVQSPVNLPQGVFTAHIDELLSDGRGLATVDKKATMISGALPGEQVEFTYENQRKQFFEGQATKILTASPYRVEPQCEAFSLCGGCSLQHLEAQQQIQFKQSQLQGNLQKQARVKAKNFAPPLAAKHWGYRRRARVGIKKVGEQIHVGFRGRYSSKIVNLTHCEVLSPELSKLLLPIAELIRGMSFPDKIPQVEMAQGDAQVALSFRHLYTLSSEDNQRFEAFAQSHNVMVYLQPEDSNSVKGLNHDNAIEYTINVKTQNDGTKLAKTAKANLMPLSMDFLPYHFTQVNFEMNEKMIQQALDWLDLQADDEVLDLFCGLGNFSLPLAQRVHKVVGVEGSQALVNWAKRNADKNQIDNVDFYQADLTQDTRMMAWRVKYHYNKVLIDPPRSGALEIMALINDIRPEKICYVSCHAATLARDIDVLVNQYGYRLVQCGVMDMFPHTAHVESMALLQRPAS